MEGKTTTNANKKKIFLNYFSNNNKLKEDKQLEIKMDDKELENSFGTNAKINRTRPHIRHLSVDKYMRTKSCKGMAKPLWNDNNKSISGLDTGNTGNKNKINLNLNLNLNVTGANIKNDKKIEEFLNNNFCKLDDTKLTRIISKSPINSNPNNAINSSSNLINYIKTNKTFKNGKLLENLCKTVQNKSPTSDKKKPLTNLSQNMTYNSHLTSKYCSLNTSFLKTPNNLNNLKYQNYKTSCIDEEPTGTEEVKPSARDKLKMLRELVKALRSQENKVINKEVDDIVGGILTTNEGGYNYNSNSNYNYNNTQSIIQTQTHNTNNFSHSNVVSLNHSSSINNNSGQVNNFKHNNAPLSNGNSNSNIRIENKLLKSKIEEIDKKFELLIRENKELKYLIKNKTEEFNKLHNEMSSFKMELKKIRNIKANNYSGNTNQSININSLAQVNQNTGNKRNVKSMVHSRQHSCNYDKSSKYIITNSHTPLNEKQKTFMKDNFSTQSKKPISTKKKSRNNSTTKTPLKNKALMIKDKEMSIDYSRLDTMDLISRAGVDDPKEVLYFPQKVNLKSNSEIHNIPKLDIVKSYIKF